MPRNRQQTENRIRQAARNLLREEGFEAWGVNGIARAAGVDKVLIYRYFESIEGLLFDLIKNTAFWPNPDDLPDGSPEAFIEATIEALQEAPETQSLLAHPSARNPLSGIQRKAEEDLRQWTKGVRDNTKGSIPDAALECLPALILLQINSGLSQLSARDIWKQVSPPLEWGSSTQWSANEELPTELL